MLFRLYLMEINKLYGLIIIFSGDIKTALLHVYLAKMEVDSWPQKLPIVHLSTLPS